jgi:hypothetical protein
MWSEPRGTLALSGEQTPFRRRLDSYGKLAE